MRIFSGIQPTGRKHLGNFIGAIRQYVTYQTLGEALYSVVDLHATTVPYDPKKLRALSVDTAAILLAAGIDPERSILFRQSDVAEHSELCWLLAGSTAFGELSRMHQFKDKSGKQKELVSAGLFFYPVLMAADILLYRTNQVPVGEDQKQHIEITRDIAIRFNERFGDTFVLPEPRIPTVGARIMDLQSPEQKMSTSAASEAGTVYVLDDDKAIMKKMKSAVTDSGNEVRYAEDKPGVSNLMQILAAVRGVSLEDVERDFAGKQYGQLKVAVGEEVVAYLRPVRERYSELRADEAALERILAKGAERARAIAETTMRAVRERMGMRGGGAP